MICLIQTNAGYITGFIANLVSDIYSAARQPADVWREVPSPSWPPRHQPDSWIRKRCASRLSPLQKSMSHHGPIDFDDSEGSTRIIKFDIIL
jgi:hypothetical protein